MSVVTNILVSHSILEDWDWEDTGGTVVVPVAAVSAGDVWWPLNDIAKGEGGDHWAGSKYAEVNLWAGAINYMDAEATLRHLASLPWKEPENVQVFIQGQEDDRFSVYEFRGPTLEKVL